MSTSILKWVFFGSTIIDLFGSSNSNHSNIVDPQPVWAKPAQRSHSNATEWMSDNFFHRPRPVAGVVVAVRRLIEIVAPADGGISIGPARPTVRDEELTKSVRISLWQNVVLTIWCPPSFRCQIFSCWKIVKILTQLQYWMFVVVVCCHRKRASGIEQRTWNILTFLFK